MAGVWKRDGTIAVTKGSKKVVGTGTTFADPKNAAAKGHLLVMVTGTAVDLYEVDYSESNSVFYLVEAYRGDTGTSKAYAIDTSRTDSIPEFARKLNASLAYYHSQSDMLQQLYTSTDDEIAITAPDGTTHKLIPWPRIMEELGNKYSPENPPPSDGGDGEPIEIVDVVGLTAELDSKYSPENPPPPAPSENGGGITISTLPPEGIPKEGQQWIMIGDVD